MSSAAREPRVDEVLLFNVHAEAESPGSTRAVVVELRHPVARHVGFDLRPVTTGSSGRRDGTTRVHDHVWHVHVEVEFDGADIDRFATGGVAEFDDDFVVGDFRPPSVW